MNNQAPRKFGVGAPVRRKEDAALITGKGRYTDDIRVEGSLHSFVLRSAMAFARFTLEGVEDARAMPGVELVLTAEDLDQINPMPTKTVMRQHDGTKHYCPPQPVLCRDTVRYVGDAIAFIVAQDLETAKAAAELIFVDYDGLDTVIGLEAALDEGAPLVWEEAGSNRAFSYGQGDEADCEAAFAKAAKTVSIKVDNNRLIANYMELRGCVAEYDESSERFTLTLGTQGGHQIRDLIAQDILGIDKERLRVVTPDVGGGFGTKMFTYREYPLALIAAERLKKPVRWQGERMEHFITDAHGRDNVSTGELALDADNRIIGMRVNVLASMGAYLHQFGPSIPFVGTSMTSGLYDIPALFVSVTGVYENKVPTDAYRGAGRPEAAYLIERLVEKAAAEVGMSGAAFRRLNFIRSEQMPYTTQTKRMYDTGDFAGHMDKAMEVADWEGFSERQEMSAADGKYRGIGMCCYIEACAFAGSEEATVELNKDGTVTLLIGTQSNGQGHATAYGQIIAEKLGLSLEQVTVVQGDTDQVRKGGGTGGSRSIPLGLPSVNGASEALAQKIRQIASDKLEVGAEDLELVDGQVRVVGTDQQISLADVASESSQKLSGVEEVVQDECTYPNGTHIAEVEVDPETGNVKIVRYVIVDDFGVTVNPMLLQGQVHGGVAQAISQALCERVVYDEDGQLVSASLLDYQLVRAGDLTEFEFQTRNVPSTTNAMGIKGAGEAGTIGGCAAIMNAVQKALSDGADVGHFDMPATPFRVWSAIQGASVA